MCKKDSGGTLLKKNKRESEVSGNRNLPSKRLWSKSKKCGYRLRSLEKEGRKEGTLCGWTVERLREAYEKVAMDDIGRLSIAQDIFRKNTDFLRRIIAPVDGRGGVLLSYVCPYLQLFPLS